MLALDRNVEITCGNCGTSVTKQQLSRNKSRCSGGTLYCPKCPHFFTKSRDDLYYHIAKKHSAAGLKAITRVKNAAMSIQAFIP